MKPSSLLVAATAFSVAASVLVGCASQAPDVPGGLWYTGTTKVDPPNFELFGPPGKCAIEWQQNPANGTWIWRENRANGWNQQTVWLLQGNGVFDAAPASGKWAGTVAINDWQGSGVWQPGGWHYQLLTVDKSGSIIGSGETADPGGGSWTSATDSGSPMYMVWIEWKFVKPDGTVAARLSQELRAVNAEEYESAVLELGGTVQR
ncbi:MAG: hypothetical protein JNM94_02560 [Phycisphaerae bacterium]|nr:hypothetical protein [Phycisphaerae bacterium]